MQPTALPVENELHGGSWNRTGDVLTDHLHMYTSSILYDCTFRAKSEDLEQQAVFKCHKFVLSAASGPFQAMLHGHFEEAKKGADDEIVLEKTCPEAFDLAMRFIYGRQEDFKNVDMAIKVYKFAHLWQIESLMTAVDKFLKNPSPDDVCKIYEMYKVLGGKEEILQTCMDVIVSNTDDVLDSPSSLDASLETVVDVLGKDSLNVESEAVLLIFLILWGEVQLIERGKKPLNGAKLRKEIDIPLKMIRFLSIPHSHFAKLCTNLLKGVLSLEEKFAILLSISNNSAEHLPEGFTSSLRQSIIAVNLQQLYI